jgi:hypothetical protein
MDFEDFLRLIRALDQHAVEYVLVRGVALSLHGLVMATEDVALFVRPEAENVERLRQALRSVWDDPEIERITAEDLAGDPDLSRRIRRLWAFSARLVSRRAPRGVQKFRSPEEAQRARAAW